MAIAFNNAAYTTGVGIGLNAATLTLNTTGSNLIVFIGIGYQDAGAVGSVSYNGTAGVRIDKVTTSGSGNFDLWYVIGAASGNANVAITAANNGTWQLGATAYTGARSNTVPDGHVVTDDIGSTTGTNTITSVSDNCWHVMYGTTTVNDTRTVSAGANTTLRTGAGQVSGMFDGNGAITPPGSNSIIVTLSSSGEPISLGATFAPIIITAVTDTITPGEALKYGKILREVMTMITVITNVFTDSITITEVTSVLKIGWAKVQRSVSSWTRQNKS